MSKRKHNNLNTKPLQAVCSLIGEPQDSALRLLLQKRTGGSINIAGLWFQLLYSSKKILELRDDKALVTLEGLEDLDTYIEGQPEHIQVKTSKNTIDTGAFWQLKILQHFHEIYERNSNARFVLMHNTFSSGSKLDGFVNGIQNKDFTSYWMRKLNEDGVTIDEAKAKDFFSRIHVRSTTCEKLLEEINKLLFENFGVNIGAEAAFLKSLFFHVFEWSKDRRSITKEDVDALIQEIRDAYSNFPANPAVQNNWISKVSFQSDGKSDGGAYFEGKGAKPSDIVNGYPVKRPEWGTQIESSVAKYDVTIIKSSSGQGKSTLGWQECYRLFQSGFSIYQLKLCENWSSASATVDFIGSRIKIGEVTVILVDGLNLAVSNWNLLAEALRELPVKFIITVREEDWIRYNGEVADVYYNVIDIKLSKEEASAMFAALQKKGKIHPSITNWGSPWEKIKEKGLLIEYVYLLTKGEMLRERLQWQIKKLNGEKDGAAKLELLRLIALADVLGIKLSTSRLVDYVFQRLQFQSDRNELLRELEREYFLKFGPESVEGLHPVRSDHLVYLLHSHIDLSDTALGVLSMTEDLFIYDFFMGIPYLLQPSAKNSFYKKASFIMSNRGFPEMVYAIDGLFHYEPYNYWLQNKMVFDEAYQKGGLKLFIADTMPDIKKKGLESLADTLGKNQLTNIFALLELKKKLTKYSADNSDVQIFMLHLKTSLESRGKVTKYEGASFLYKSFKRFDVQFPKIIEIPKETLLQQLREKDISESSDLFHFYSLVNPEEYKIFLAQNREEVIGWLKRKTDTLSIYEQGNSIVMEYLLYDSIVQKANELSIYRINMGHALFPHYGRYCTNAIMLPLPTRELIKASLDDAHKTIPAENLYDSYDIHNNQIWMKTIEACYSATSSFEWQDQNSSVRKKAIEFTRQATYMIESFLEDDDRKKKSQFKSFADTANDFVDSYRLLFDIPGDSKKYFEKARYGKEQETVNKYFNALRNVASQFEAFLAAKREADVNLAVVNIKTAFYYLPKMQEAVQAISGGTDEYFDTTDVRANEIKWIRRLYESMQFIQQHFRAYPMRLVAAGKVIPQWYADFEAKRLNDLHTVLRNNSVDGKFEFILPNRIKEIDNLQYAEIGLARFDTTNIDLVMDLSYRLRNLADVDAHFFTFVIIDANNRATHAFRVSKGYFEKVNALVNTGKFDDDGFDRLLPIALSESDIQTLPNVLLKEVTADVSDEAFIRMMFNVWKLVEYRTRLNPKNVVEGDWMKELNEKYSSLILEDLEIASTSDIFKLNPSRGNLEQFLKGEFTYSSDDVLYYIQDRYGLLKGI